MWNYYFYAFHTNGDYFSQTGFAYKTSRDYFHYVIAVKIYLVQKDWEIRR